MAKKISRRTFIKKTLSSFLALIGAGAGGFFYARDIEPRLLEISHHQIKNSFIPKGFHQFKIIQFSDTHLGFHYDLEQFKKLLKKIMDEKPDIIFFTGDLMDEPNKYYQASSIIPLLQQLEAPFGKFAIYGNHDHGGYGTDIYKGIMENAGFQLLNNENKEIKLLDGSSLHIIGIDDAMLGNPDIGQAVSGIPAESYKILLSHAPDLADEAANYQIHLQLSGHSHGGQIKIPFIGALVKVPFAVKYQEGFYELSGKSPLTLYVNRGIGTTRLPFRFLTKPELSVFTLVTEEESSSK